MSSFYLRLAVLLSACIITSASQGMGPLETRSSICSQLRDVFAPEVLVLKDHPQYQKLRTKNWSQTAWRHPACIFRPTTASELQQAMPLLVHSGAKFAIRSGGHSPSPWAANIDFGVLIDLSALNNISYSAADRLVTVGPGLTWGDVYEKLDPLGITVVGGRVSGVGVGGLILGGGLSYLSELHGLASDNVVNFEVVLANGTIVNANRTHHPDLHWALKGGGNNFGIVTSFTLSAYSIGQVWAGIRMYTPDKLPALYGAMLEYQSSPRRDAYANVMLQGFFTKQSTSIMLSLVYLKPEKWPPAFAPFLHIQAESDTTSLVSFGKFIAGQGPPSFPARAYFRTTTFRPDARLYKSLADLMMRTRALKRVKAMVNGTIAFGMQPISPNLVQAGKDRGTNSLGLLSANQTWYEINAGCEFAENDHQLRMATRSILGGVVERATAEDVHVPYLFMNDAGWDQDVLASYGAENLARLRDVQASYDGSRVFQRLVRGGFKLHHR